MKTSRQTRQADRKPRPYILSDKQISEDAGAFWFRALMSDGRTILMSVPK